MFIFKWQTFYQPTHAQVFHQPYPATLFMGLHLQFLLYVIIYMMRNLAHKGSRADHSQSKQCHLFVWVLKVDNSFVIRLKNVKFTPR